MAHTALTPVFVGLRTGLHILFVALIALVVGRAVLAPTGDTVAVVVVALVLLASYATGGLVARSARSAGRLGGLLWLAVLTLEWVALLLLSPQAAYLVFPLFFLYLHLLGRWQGTAAVVAATVVAIVALGVQGGWSVGGVVGPLVGAGVALLIGLGYQALAVEARERERLLQELMSARDQLARSEHESGILAERARLAREIHDTVAQGLSSIQMLLHAAERADTDRPGVAYIRLARETAAADLAATRRFIRELTPPDLDTHGLGGALRRLAETQWSPQGLDVEVRVSDETTLPMHLQTALLRIAQGAVANVIQHAGATRATVSLVVSDDEVRFSVDDDGQGFDPEAPTFNAGGTVTDSFGLRATRERVEQLGGVLTIDSTPTHGTSLRVDLTVDEQP